MYSVTSIFYVLFFLSPSLPTGRHGSVESREQILRREKTLARGERPLLPKAPIVMSTQAAGSEKGKCEVNNHCSAGRVSPVGSHIFKPILLPVSRFSSSSFSLHHALSPDTRKTPADNIRQNSHLPPHTSNNVQPH